MCGMLQLCWSPEQSPSMLRNLTFGEIFVQVIELCVKGTEWILP